jgi:hypothetical protein
LGEEVHFQLKDGRITHVPFKEFMEERQRATGAWRGEIHGRSVHKPEEEAANHDEPSFGDER